MPTPDFMKAAPTHAAMVVRSGIRENFILSWSATVGLTRMVTKTVCHQSVLSAVSRFSPGPGYFGNLTTIGRF
jgi:hypothetical protein